MLCSHNEDGIGIGGWKINCTRFADDMVILANDTRVLQKIKVKLEKECGIKINVGKTNVTRINNNTNVTVIVRKRKLQVQKYRKLGSILT